MTKKATVSASEETPITNTADSVITHRADAVVTGADGAKVYLCKRTLLEVNRYRRFIAQGVGCIGQVAHDLQSEEAVVDAVLLDFAYVSSMVIDAENIPFMFLGYADDTPMIARKLKVYIEQGIKVLSLLDDINRAIGRLNAPDDPHRAPGSPDTDPKQIAIGEPTSSTN